MPVYNERFLVRAAVERVLEVESPRIAKLDLILVDDGSTDGTREILAELAAKHGERVTVITHAQNQGKGAAVRTGLEQAQGWVTVVQDADLEYDPRDLDLVLEPFLEEGADAVYGSRFLSGRFRRVLYYRHSIANRLLTTLCNLITDLNLSDMETCTKAVRTSLLRSIPIRSNDFRIEPELTIKLAKRGARLFEVPIRYAGRTYQEGKKIRARDGLLAVGAMLRFWVIDDLYREDDIGAEILRAMSGVPKFNRWMADVLRPFVGSRVLEIGAGIGNLTQQLAPRDRYTASDVSPHYLEYLRGLVRGKPTLDVAEIDVTRAEDFEGRREAYDTVICLNVLEHLDDEAAALANIRSALAPGGRALLLVPQGPWLFGSLDEALGHVRRYTRESFRAAVANAGFELETLFDFNRGTVPGWWLNGRLLRRRHFSKPQLKLVNLTTGVLRVLDRVLPWHGASLIAVARRPADSRV
jgi:glycosyltransferase involved in cell wall biosynthesis